MTWVSAAGPQEITVQAHGLDPNGVERVLARAPAGFASGDAMTEALFDLPPELRNRISRFSVDVQRSAGAVSLSDDSLKRREIALLAGNSQREGLELLSPLHYLRQALVPTSDLIDGNLEDVLLANPDALIMADVAQISEFEEDQIIDWVMEGWNQHGEKVVSWRCPGMFRRRPAEEAG